MRILTAEFIRSCAGPEQFLKSDLPEVAFIGRSNVGKSSLINSLLQRKGLAKVSRTPGKTRLINLFRVTSSDPGLANFVVVDLPGYGYAKVSKALRAQWAPLIEQYLGGSEQLRVVVLLVESRVLSEQDGQTIERIAVRPAIIAAAVIVYGEARPLHGHARKWVAENTAAVFAIDNTVIAGGNGQLAASIA